MSILALDTSSYSSWVTLRCVSGVNHDFLREQDKSHESELVLIIGEALKRSVTECDPVETLVIGLGPGSFTGLRIGLGVMKGIALAQELPLIGFSSMLGAAQGRCGDAACIVVLRDARRDELFAAMYRSNAGRVEEYIAPTIILKSEAEKWSHDRAAEVGCTSDTVLVLTEETLDFKSLKVESIRDVSGGLAQLAATQAAALRQNRSFNVRDIALLAPLYVREVAAKTIEERRQCAF